MKTIVLSFILFSVHFLHAQQAGQPDSSFHADGKLATRLPDDNGTAKAIALQPDGKILIGGYSNNDITNNDFTVARYHADGLLDSSFNSTGILQIDFDSTDDIANGIAVSASGEKIIIGGFMFNGADFDFAVAQYNTDASPDTSFGTDGKVIIPFGGTSFAHGLTVQDDGKIILMGYSMQSTNEFALVRLHPDGTLDSTFGGDGKVLTPVGTGASIAHCIVIQPDNKIVVAGESANDSTLRWEIALARYNEDGSLDDGFDDDGKLTITNGNIDNFANGVGLQSDGKIVLAGYSGTSPSNNQFLLVRFNSDGRIDSTFGTNGFLNTAFSPQNNQALSLLVQPDDKLIVGGLAMVNNVNKFALARFDADGNLDNTFGTGGKVTTSIGTNDGIYAITHDADWKILAAGTAFHGAGFDFALARYLNDITTGVSNPVLSGHHLAISPNPVRHAATLHFTLQKDELVTIQLVNMQGRVIDTFISNENVPAGSYSKTFLLPEMLPAGPYALLVSSAWGIDAVKVMKQ